MLGLGLADPNPNPNPNRTPNPNPNPNPDPDQVRPGDASVAAPFTSRAPSVRNLVDLIRQGRCTLLSALQQQQIMMLESLISAYAPISPLYLP